MSSKQRQIATTMALIILYTLALLNYGAQIFATTTMDGDSLTYILSWLLLPTFSLIVGIGNLARTRFFNANLIDGEKPAENSIAEIDARYLQNTLEQFAIALVVFISLGLQLPPQKLPLIAALCSNFLLMRIIFWVGYRKLPQLRALGFAGTFYPTIGAFIYSLSLAFS